MTTNHTVNTMKNILKALQILLLVTVSVASQAAVESTTYILTDHLGSPILATDENGDTLWREDYQPYGKQLTNEDGDNSVGFTGHKDDKALGVTYMQGRWYHEGMGRFLSIDPVGFVEGNPASFNRYAYANNNPYKYVDPDGRAGEDALAAYTIFLAVDAATPEPTDVLWPKWAIHALATGTLSTVVWMTSESGENGNDTSVSAEGQTSSPVGPPDPNGDDDRYENPGHHDPSGRGPNPYIRNKSVLPKNHEQLWGQSRLAKDGNRWAKVGNGKKAEYHRFQNDGNGNWHWNGSTKGVTASGTPRAIKMKDVPSEVLKW